MEARTPEVRSVTGYRGHAHPLTKCIVLNRGLETLENWAPGGPSLPKSPGRVETLHIGMAVFPSPRSSDDSIIHCVLESGSKPMQSYGQGCHLMEMLFAIGQDHPAYNLEWSFCNPLSIFPKGWPGSFQELLSTHFFGLT